jgi:para-nitrobenzyl esterase
MHRRAFVVSTIAAAATALPPMFSRSAEPSGPRVSTRQGLLEGFAEDDVNKFLGIPFATPPVGALRWQAPRAPEHWTGVRRAKQFGSACIQTRLAGERLRTSGSFEDCLYLNVWSTALAKAADQPVMLWIHGGGNFHGAGSTAEIDGTNLAKLGVTVVTVNYRLGAFGYLNDPVMGANFAVLDNVAALSWVRENIEGFGGDPSRVTVFGNSSGAVDIRALLQCPHARGLFHRAIMESAGGEAPAGAVAWSSNRSREATQELFKRLASASPLSRRAIPAERVNEAARALSGILPEPNRVHTPLDLVWMPVPDEKIIMAKSFPGWVSDVPVMYGFLQNEARFFLNPTDNYSAALLSTMTGVLAGRKAEEVLEILDTEGGSIYDKLDRLYTTVVWREPVYASMCRFAAERRRIFYFEFARASPGAIASNRLVYHTSEIPYVFANLSDDGTYNDVDRRVSRDIQVAFVEFAKTGKPQGTSGLPWPMFDPAQPKKVVITDSVAIAPYQKDALLSTINSMRKAV